MGLTRIKGSVWDSSDNIVVDTITGLSDIAKEGIVFAKGHTTPNDGGGGQFNYDPDRNRVQANDGTIIDPSGTGIGLGCWVRQYNLSNYSLAFFGSNDSNVNNLLTVYGTDGAVVIISSTDNNAGAYVFYTALVGGHDGLTNFNGWVSLNAATSLGISWKANTLLTSFTAVSGNGYLVGGTNTTINLPSGSDGDKISIADFEGTWADFPVTILGNIEGDTALIADVSFTFVDLVFSGISNQWEIVSTNSRASNEAADVNYDNTLINVLSSINVQDAVDELATIGGGGGGGTAASTTYDNSTSLLAADDVQEAVDELDARIDSLAGSLPTVFAREILSSAAGQLIFIFTNAVVDSNIYIKYIDFETTRLFNGLDYSLTNANKTVNLQESLPLGAQLIAE